MAKICSIYNFRPSSYLVQKLIKFAIMRHMERLRQEIEDYIFENGKEYDRLLMSQSFYNKLEKEVEERDSKIDLPNLEVKEGVNYDFKLLP